LLQAFERQCLSTLQRALAEAQSSVQQVGRFTVGFSGGLDSSALLQAMAKLKQNGNLASAQLQAVYINHGLSTNAEAWGQHCAALANKLGIPFQIVEVELVAKGLGVEAAAREARYQALAAPLKPGDCLLTGHHLDDQAETVLLRLLRGAGPKGLAAMSLQRSLGNGLLLRPLLDQTKQQLENYAMAEQLVWIEDESNQSLELDRNYLRQEIMPKLEQRWPGFSQRWGQSAQLCGLLDQQLESIAEQHLDAVDLKQERLGSSLKIDALLKLSLAERYNLLRLWLQKQSYASPSLAQLNELSRQLLDSDWSDQQARVVTGDQVWARYQGRLYSLPNVATSALNEAVVWSVAKPLTLPGGWSLQAIDDEQGICLPSVVRVGARPAGLRCQPRSRRHSQSLKKLLQEFQLEPWLRPIIPLVWAGEELLGVADLWLESGWIDPTQGPKKRLRWYYAGKPITGPGIESK